MELTKKKLLELAQILGAVEVEAGDREVAKMHLQCVAYSRGAHGCSGRFYRNDQGKFFVAKSISAARYFGIMVKPLKNGDLKNGL